MNLKDIKNQFPIFKSNKNLIYFDTANSAQKPIQVIDALDDFYKNHYAISAEPFMVLQHVQQLITTAQGKLSKN